MTFQPGSTEEFPRSDATSTARNPQDVSSSFTPVKRLAAEHQIKVLCIGIAIVVPVVCLYFMLAAVRSARAPQTTFAVDGAGVIHVGPLESLNPDTQFFRELALQVSQAQFTRNPNGLSAPELARRLFTPEAMKQVDAEVAAEADLFKRRNYFQQPEIAGIDPLEPSGDKRRFRVRGYVRRTGAVDGIPDLPPAYYFRVTYELVPNAFVGQRGQYPYQVARYRLTWTDERWEPLQK
ncbi:hypothetical protein [Oleiharenicola sp. Vm1]|uniref:hypothetical protein n=1 Tax=Oleiharenicola sp. Vm1 TaxID=3398393 RepID=UPI0039F45B70